MADDKTMETALAIVAGKDGDGAMVAGTPWTIGQARVLCRTLAPGLSPDEFKLFGMRCQATGLDPFLGQIHAVKRKGKDGDKVTFQTGIDGFRLTAHRSRACAGIDDPTFTYAAGDDKQEHPLSASCTVYRMVEGQRCGFTATARYSEYYPGGKQGFMWDRMPHVMIGKCSEGLAIRKGFPNDTAGLYLDEEMHQADAPSGADALNAQLTEPKAPASDEPVDADFTDVKPPDDVPEIQVNEEMTEMDKAIAKAVDIVQAMPAQDQNDIMDKLVELKTVEEVNELIAVLPF